MDITEGLALNVINKEEFYIDMVSGKTVYIYDKQTEGSVIIVQAATYDEVNARTSFITVYEKQLREPSTAEANIIRGV